MSKNIYEDIRDVYFEALKNSLKILFDENEESFYYVVLVVDENGFPPVFSAWSDEALDSYKNENDLSDEETVWAKWSYSESPYFNFQEEIFSEAAKLWNSKGLIDDFKGEQWQRELKKRVSSLEDALRNINDSIFTKMAINRDLFLINVEDVPPSKETTQRAVRLNGMNEKVNEWLDEAAE